MIENVRRLEMLMQAVFDVFVATCDEDIATVIRSFDGKVFMTADTQRKGTPRVADVIKDVDCTHVILLQGDEPLLFPHHVDAVADGIWSDPEGDAWNATGPIESAEALTAAHL